jgi:hypothetical protein
MTVTQRESVWPPLSESPYAKLFRVRECLEFSALMRQGKQYSRAEKLLYVDEVMQLLELTPLADVSGLCGAVFLIVPGYHRKFGHRRSGNRGAKASNDWRGASCATRIHPIPGRADQWARLTGSLRNYIVLKKDCQCGWSLCALHQYVLHRYSVKPLTFSSSAIRRFV